MNIDQTPQSGWLSPLREMFAIDARSLALLRIVIALIIICDLVATSQNLDVFYSEEGVLPQVLNQDAVLQSGPGWSVYWLSDSNNWTLVCLGVNFVAAFCLLVGFKTFLATVFCLVMAWSLQIRNPLVLTGGHVLLRMILFWGLFLPWGSWLSVDSRAFVDPRPARWRVSNFGSAGMMIQVACLYFFSGIAKQQGSWNSHSIVQALHLEMGVKPLGDWMAQFPSLLELLSPALLVLEIVGPLLLFAPFVWRFWRGSMMALMWIMHFAIFLSMSIGIFSVVAIAAWLIFVPSAVWNGLLGHPQHFENDQIVSHPRMRQAWQVVAALFLGFILLLNLLNINRESSQNPLSTLAKYTMTQQEFEMFAFPPERSPWPQYLAETQSGEINIFDLKGELGTEKPKSVYKYSRSQFWRRYHLGLVSESPEVSPIVKRLRNRLFNYQVDKWNNQRPDALIETALLMMHFDELENGVPNGKSTKETWATKK